MIINAAILALMILASPTRSDKPIWPEQNSAKIVFNYTRFSVSKYNYQAMIRTEQYFLSILHKAGCNHDDGRVQLIDVYGTTLDTGMTGVSQHQYSINCSGDTNFVGESPVWLCIDGEWLKEGTCELRCVIPDYWSLEDFRVVKGMYPVINSGQSVLVECLKPSRWESGRMELNCNDGILAPDFICGRRRVFNAGGLVASIIGAVVVLIGTIGLCCSCAQTHRRLSLEHDIEVLIQKTLTSSNSGKSLKTELYK